MSNDDNKITKETLVEKDVLAFGDNLHHAENQDLLNTFVCFKYYGIFK